MIALTTPAPAPRVQTSAPAPRPQTSLASQCGGIRPRALAPGPPRPAVTRPPPAPPSPDPPLPPKGGVLRSAARPPAPPRLDRAGLTGVPVGTCGPPVASGTAVPSSRGRRRAAAGAVRCAVVTG